MNKILSIGQQQLWAHETINSDLNIYNVGTAIQFHGLINTKSMQEACDIVVNRNEALRTVLHLDEGALSAKMLQPFVGICKLSDFASLNLKGAELNAHIKKIFENRINTKFNLETGPLVRLDLLSYSREIHVLIFLVHHVVFDGASFAIFTQELSEAYNTLVTSAHIKLPEKKHSYSDFVAEQNKRTQAISQNLNYWKKQLEDLEPLSIPVDKPYDITTNPKIEAYNFSLSQSIISELESYSFKCDATIFYVLFTTYCILLHRYTGQNDFTVNTPFHGRKTPKLKNIIGFFVNTLPLRVDFTNSTTFLELIKQVINTIGEAHLYQEVSLSQLATELNISRDSHREIFAQTSFAFQTTFLPKSCTFNGLSHKVVSFEAGRLPMDVGMEIYPSEGNNGYDIVLKYNSSLYNESTIKRLAIYWQEILANILKHAPENLIVSQLPILPEEERKQILVNWNSTDKEYPSHKTIHQLFEEQVEKTPDNIAVVYEDIRLTYKELNERSNQLANYLLRHYDIKPDTLVILCLDRSEHMLIAILAVLKAGGAYVPIDLSYPDERIEYILDDTKANAVLTNEIHKKRLEGLLNTLDRQSNNIISTIDSDLIEVELKMYSNSTPLANITTSNLAYVIYTSGTTGKPKGVMIEHRGVINLAVVQSKEFGLNNQEIKSCLWYSNYVFDAHVWEVYSTILTGNTIHLINDNVRQNIGLLEQYIQYNAVTVATIPPALLNDKNLLLLNTLVVAGEKTSKEILDFYYDNNVRVINAYGPSETTVCATLNHYNDNGITNIGSPISNHKCYVLDSNLNPLPIGAIGELYIGGDGVARGYLNQPELTAEKFIKNPFQTAEEKADISYGPQGRNTRLYKTGDLVRWLPDGNLEYIGRMDFQVKIHGFRIELGEIESVLSSYSGVKQCVVIAKEHHTSEDSNNKYLVGYYVADNKLVEDKILSYLQDKLPEYMVPGIFVYLEKLPLTINGKVDRKALPDPEFTSSEHYAPPRNELEAAVCVIWSEVLGLCTGKIGIQDNFFRLGGDSIVSIQLVSRIRQRLGLNLSIKDIFNYKTIEKLYDNVLSKDLTDKAEIKSEQGTLYGEAGLLPIQEWFFENNFAKAPHWNQSFLIKTPELDIEKLKACVEQLVKYHDAFKLKYKRNENKQYIQYYDSPDKIEELRILDVRTLGVKEGSKELDNKFEEILTNWQRGFDLGQGPLYSMGYIHGYKDGSSRIFFALHHLIVDTVSWRILLEDLKTLYEGKHLGLKGSSYRQWVSAVEEYVHNHEEERNYWENALIGYDETKQFTELAVNKNVRNYASLELSTKETQQLLKETSRAYNTQINDLLLTALSYALSEVTGNKVNYVTIEGHGREEIDKTIDVTRTIGWFTTMYPIRLEAEKELGKSIKYVKETLRQVPNKGIGYGALFGYKLDKLPRISFNYLGQFEEQQEKESFWNITNENSGITVDEANYDNNVLNINGLVINGKLQFSIVSKLDNEVTDRLANLFKQKLVEVVKYCINKSCVEYNISDFNDFTPYIVLNEYSNTRNCLFIFPPGEGGAESYLNNIVPKLNMKKLVLFNNYFLYLTQQFGLEQVQNITFQNLAREYLYYIKMIQNKGPYNLFGWSFGGVLAFEIAIQLLNNGEKVANIVLIDSLFNYKKGVSNIDFGVNNTPIAIKNNINYKYFFQSPLEATLFKHTNVILFKAVKLIDQKNLPLMFKHLKIHDKNLYKILNYYVEKVPFNYLDNILMSENFIVKTINCDHFSWVNNELEITKITEELLNL